LGQRGQPRPSIPLGIDGLAHLLRGGQQTAVDRYAELACIATGAYRTEATKPSDSVREAVDTGAPE
jgi:hypothetical protein